MLLGGVFIVKKWRIRLESFAEDTGDVLSRKFWATMEFGGDDSKFVGKSLSKPRHWARLKSLFGLEAGQASEAKALGHVNQRKYIFPASEDDTQPTLNFLHSKHHTVLRQHHPSTSPAVQLVTILLSFQPLYLSSQPFYVSSQPIAGSSETQQIRQQREYRLELQVGLGGDSQNKLPAPASFSIGTLSECSPAQIEIVRRPEARVPQKVTPHIELY